MKSFMLTLDSKYIDRLSNQHKIVRTQVDCKASFGELKTVVEL